MAKFKTKFKAFGRAFCFTLNTDNLARDYDDEDFAYWIKYRGGFYFEINIKKELNKEGYFDYTDKGWVKCYETRGNFEDDKYTETHSFTFHRA